MRDKELHRRSIIDAAMKEFLEYGFKDASMRRIAFSAGMSVSGLYKHFTSKEEMFSALVEPACQGFLDLYLKETEDQRRNIDNGDLSSWENGRDAKIAISYIYDHLDAFRLIICRSQGTKYDSFLHDLAVLEEETTLSFMETLKERGFGIRDFRRNEFHLLVTTNITAVFQTIEHQFTKEEAMHYADTLDHFFAKGWEEFFGY